MKAISLILAALLIAYRVEAASSQPGGNDHGHIHTKIALHLQKA